MCFRSHTVLRENKRLNWYCSISDAFNSEGQPLKKTWSYTRDRHTDITVAFHEKDWPRCEKVIRELTGTMAATLSTEEEQVGRGSVFFFYAYTSFFPCYTEAQMFQMRSNLEVFRPCAHRSEFSDVSAQWICYEMVPKAERKCCIDFWRLGPCSCCTTISSSTAAGLKCCETGRVRLHQPSQM